MEKSGEEAPSEEVLEVIAQALQKVQDSGLSFAQHSYTLDQIEEKVIMLDAINREAIIEMRLTKPDAYDNLMLASAILVSGSTAFGNAVAEQVKLLRAAGLGNIDAYKFAFAVANAVWASK